MDLPETEKKSGRGFWYWLSWVAGLGLFYVLSIGPVAWAWKHATNPALKSTIQTVGTFVYWPLEQIASKSDKVGSVLVAYFEWWTGPNKT